MVGAAVAGLVIWTANPANDAITEGFPIGNGLTGALVCGAPECERLVLSEGTLFGGGPYDPANPASLKALPKVRQLVFAGKPDEAARLADEEMMAKPRWQMPFQTVGDLLVEFPGHGEVTEYRRELDIDGAIARVSYKAGGVRYTREYIASYPARVLAMRFTADRKGALSMAVRMRSPHSPVEVAGGADWITMAGPNGAARGIGGALKWEASARITAPRGRTAFTGGALAIEGADEVTVVTAIATSYVSYRDTSGDPAARNRGTLERSAPRTFGDLLAEHQAAHRAAFRRFSLDLGGAGNPATALPVEARIACYGDGRADPALAAFYVQFARYLMLSCSRPGGQPATLQGIWVDSLDPPWSGKYTININTEMNYWMAEPANLGECVEPLSAMVHDISETGARTARTMYDAPGWVCHHNSDLWRATAPIDGVQWGMWPMGGAWLCLHLWDRYAFDGDRERLARDYPVMRGAAEFFLATLVKDPNTGYLVTCPSMSPENIIPGFKDTSTCAGPTMDMSIIRDLFAAVGEAAAALGKDPELREQLAKTRERLAPLKVGKAGQLQEWQEDWDLEAPERTHRHVSHLFALHPSAQVSPVSTPGLAKAARKTLELRGDDGTGWSLAWKINFWARLHDGERVARLLGMLLSPGRTYPNLFDAHPPFQIDGNFGGANGILEALVQSHIRDANGGYIVHLLPALPAQWPAGAVAGLRARGGVVVDMEWRGGKLAQARLTASRSGSYRVRIGSAERTVELRAGEPAEIRPQ